MKQKTLETLHLSHSWVFPPSHIPPCHRPTPHTEQTQCFWILRPGKCQPTFRVTPMSSRKSEEQIHSIPHHGRWLHRQPKGQRVLPAHCLPMAGYDHGQLRSRRSKIAMTYIGHPVTGPLSLLHRSTLVASGHVTRGCVPL